MIRSCKKDAVTVGVMDGAGVGDAVTVGEAAAVGGAVGVPARAGVPVAWREETVEVEDGVALLVARGTVA